MNKPIHPAVAEHVMEENRRLREVLRCIADLPMDRCSTENDYRLSAAKAIALGALSPQAEPTDTFTAVDMATAAAQGFRDGQAAVEPAPAQDEREAFKRALHSQKVFKLSSATIDAAEWAWFARPAQTAPQPEQLPYWEPCNPGCDPEFNGARSRHCAELCHNARAALSAQRGEE
ncbi:hypothetical protein [Stutzerimonas nitrititolerans]|uniref:Uncharacterized protein n=1 Tax=Stutzerimonas nitrititolerans TaxID=2482751 RepID=A0AA42BE74_9GAMM|nr:hypothetical protein [Stutzerimonas nitrititolerans]MCO7546132.1 hypothetical protein [Stutzerimonas nitrititolerans]